jgi:pyridoxine kinase
MRQTVMPAADVITPNQFELGLITGLPTDTVDDVVAAADAARAMGPNTVLVTSVITPGQADRLSMIMVTGAGAWSITTPLLPQTFTGAGDLTAAVFLGGLLTREDPVEALADTAAVAYEVLSVTAELGSRELQLVAAQDRIAEPRHSFAVDRLR